MINLVVVDDQSTIREFLKIHLDSVPDIYLIEFASNGKEAISAVEKYQPDIVLMDIEMPVLNGIEATKIISERFIDVMVILFTTRNDKQQLNLALKAGARGYVLKSSDPQDLINIIRSTRKGFFNIGPILGNWNEEPMSTSVATESQNTSGLSQTSDISQVLSNFTDQIIELRNVIESQESKIVNLTNRFVTKEGRSNNKLNGKKFLPGTKNFRPNYTRYSLTEKRQNALFISGFFLGAIAVMSILIMVAFLKAFIF